MDTKEIKDVIMFLENCIHHGEEDNLQAYEVKYNHWMKKIIILLKRGEKHEAIVKEIDEFLEMGTIYEVPEGCRSSRHIDIIKYTINKIKQKYFPKPIKKAITIKIEGEDYIALRLATVIMKKALKDWNFKKDINFEVKECDNEIKMG